MIAAVGAKTARPFNVNVFCDQPAAADCTREAAWRARLDPELARHGAKQPRRLTETYQPFRADDAKPAVIVYERPAAAGYRAALLGSPAEHTVMTSAISGRPARCLANRFTALGSAVERGVVPSYPIAYDAGKALHAAAKAKGEFGYGAQWAGQGAPLSRALPAAELVMQLRGEMEQALANQLRATISQCAP